MRRGAVRGARAVGGEARVVHPVVEAHERTERLPELVAPHGQGEIPRPGAERLVGEEGLVRGAHRGGHLAVGQVGADHAREDAELAVEHGHVDVLATARLVLHPQGVHDPEGGVHARHHVRHGHAAAHAPPARLAGDADHAALGLDDEIEGGAITVGPVLPEARDRAVDDAGVAPPGLLVGDAELLERPHAVVLQDHVGLLHEAEVQLAARRILEVDLHALLVAVQAHEVGRLRAGEGRPPGARDVAAVRGFHLHHLGAKVAEHRGAERAGEGMGEIQDLHILERHLHRLILIGRRA